MKIKRSAQLTFTVIIILVATSYMVFAQSGRSLDALMDESEMQRTGIYKLSTTERIELKNWIDKNYIPRSKSPLSKSYNRLPTISEVLSNGQFIRLDDDTTWQIYPADTPTTQGWLTPVPIQVTFVGRGAYPYTLTNTVTGSEVRARKINHIPSTMPF